MPIIKLVPKYCCCPGKPDLDNYGLGTVWQCDNFECKAHWELREVYYNRLWCKISQNY